ncbi:AraC-type DNA-binding protein [Dyadobacter sp. SG02]|uniref:AraC family transcriptional regulator n=1 Tax=Dyadobacter sp. SG02 TaxID=1855291 RepID=UPI0008B78BD2|nr:AraC family transcriptional regulator [Dyadobacter sp. SG02]SEJ75488.1 AraC-type DNA-binding protein [Dyadobacter sp. SG02]
MGKNPNPVISEYHLNINQPAAMQIGIYDLRSYLTRYITVASRPHIHSYYQIIWFKSGFGKHFVDFQEYDVIEDAMFFIGKGQVHYFDDNTDYDGVLIHFNELFVSKADSELNFFLKCDLFNNPFQLPSCCVAGENNDRLELVLDLMRTEISEVNSFGRDDMLQAFLKTFLIQVQRKKNAYEQTQGKTPFIVNGKRAQLVRFVNLIDENFTKGLNVSDYASQLNISARTLSDLTNQTLNKTPSQMIQERVTLEAQRLLVHSSQQISQIGYRLGFEDPSYFVKFFKKHSGVSPSEFRRSVS